MNQILGLSDSEIFVERESEVRRYSRCFPAVFDKAKQAHVFAADGSRYIDFFCGASALNYGHNNPHLKERILSYLEADGVMHALDMYTTAKRDFLRRFQEVILGPRDLDHKVQFCGPSGSDAVEAALKLARKATGRAGVIAFSGAYHGMTLGSLAATGGRGSRRAAGVPLHDTTFLPFETGPWGHFDSLALMERTFSDSSSGVELPAAVIVEPIQMEGGIFPASEEWLRGLRELTSKHGVLLITDEIQSGCGRGGSFFRFEKAGIRPDLVTLSKSISGYGYPMSLLLIDPAIDIWHPGEHAGTFRGNQLAFVAGTAALDFWEDPAFLVQLADLELRLNEFRRGLSDAAPQVVTRGAGAVLGVDMRHAGGGARAEEIQRECFNRGLIVEVCGRDDEVVKVMPPLTVDDDTLAAGLEILHKAVVP